MKDDKPVHGEIRMTGRELLPDGERVTYTMFFDPRRLGFANVSRPASERLKGERDATD